MSKFYDGTKLLSLSDSDGNKPEIYVCTSNRSAGKTTFFSRYLVNRFLKHKEKFCLIYRYKYELNDCAEKFFKDINYLFFNDYTMENNTRMNGTYHDLYLIRNDDPEKKIHCGYAVAINSAEQIKKLSHLLSDVERMFFDEFQSENNTYCPNEIDKFISIHTSLARGKSKQVRYLPVIMLSNPVTILNPYYVEWGISTKLKRNTKFLRMPGLVLEQSYNEAASIAQTESGFNRAFAKNRYVAYSGQSVYLQDSTAFIGSISGRSKYLATVKVDKIDFAIREFPDLGIIYCNKVIDYSFPFKLSVTVNDHDVNYVLLKTYDLFINQMRYFFDHGCFRFRDLQCKNAIIKMLSY